MENTVDQLKSRQEILEREKSALEKFFELTDTDTDHLVEINEELKDWTRKKNSGKEKGRYFHLPTNTLEKHTSRRYLKLPICWKKSWVDMSLW